MTLPVTIILLLEIKRRTGIEQTDNEKRQT